MTLCKHKDCAEIEIAFLKLGEFCMYHTLSRLRRSPCKLKDWPRFKVQRKMHHVGAL